MASESAGQAGDKQTGHRNHFQLLQEEGFSWSGMEPNTLFQNRGDGTFDEVGNVLGTYLRLDSRGAAAADLDGDGDLDLAVYNRNNPVIKLVRNDAPGQGNAVAIDLKGTESGPMAVGAQVVASCGGRQVLRQVEVGSGFISQSPPRLHFGLGDCRTVDSVSIRWPSGLRQTLS
ncbi:MAG: ASPIC/UnbV domain-containing protein, partial [Acidimicrobiia bacterium]|nr:ASPIC/UnbV domain-containing protein [Acidimicrobiia bacterium]